ncbi:hypothetical protein [Streptomyces cyaneofuscatus]|uniref:Uncharacterized protein n=1 Tax=Streptomyces cyaneofuscatus TaxID=66883 RepID=A0ABZ1F4G5_9ACTN|nr:hypothetical protein [Streptomyces cyaneofuscatus]WSB11304.1 hypothetical protein OG849_30660 [Streptomyces cyaneofuscatus]WSD45162.1 hypothetical protein OG857_04740 [Streptomyces cyaneofuscatus]WTA88356.1 hypothetical protein OG323_04820 [Streptomyces cyaneofuscatus]
MSTDNMSMGKRMRRELGLLAIDAVKESARAAYRQEYEIGFDDAAQTCLRVLSEASDELLEKMKTGNLSKQEQALYARLKELKEEMGDRLQSAWGTGPAEETLPQPVVSRRQQTRLP